MKHYFASFLRLCLFAALLAGTFLQAPSTVYAAPNDISGSIIKDVEGDAIITGPNDVGLQGVRVYLFRDVNGNNLPDNSDVHLSTAVTNSAGNYSFTNALGGPLSALPNGTYWVVAATSAIDSLGATIEQTYGAAGVMIDPDSNSATETDFRASAGAAYGGRRMDTYDSFSSTNMDLNAAEHIVRIQLDGATQHTNIDFGFGFIDSLMAGYSEFYVPAATDLVLEGMDTLNPTVGNSAMRIIISITTSTDNTTIFYDHWEDGYDFDPNNPYVFDDDGTDLVRQVVNGGTPEIFEGVNVPVLPRGSAVYYDFGDHIYITGGPVSVSVNYWVEATGTVYAMSWEMYPVKPFQTKYSIPGSLLRENNGGTGTIDIDGNGTADVNEYPTGVDVNGDTVVDIPRTDYRDFETVLGFVQATEDGTVVTATDSFGNPMTLVSYNPATGAPVSAGTAPVLNKGQSVIVGQVFNGATPVGTKNGSLSATIVGSKPIQVTTLIGSDALGDYQSYGFSTTPSILWDDEYFLPVAFDGAANGDWATVYFNNQNPYSIRIHYESQTDSGVFTVPAYSIYDFEHLRDGVANDTPRLTNSAYRFVSEGGAKFSAFASFDVEDITRDWGINLVPGYILRNEYYLGWAPGANNYVADGTVPFPSTTGANGSPAWVTPRYDNTVVYYDGNFDGIADNPAGTSLNRYDSLKIYNPSTDQSGLHIWATGPLAVAYGEDPAVAGPGNPYMDLGYGLLPLPMDWMDVALGVIKTTDSPTIPNGVSLPVNFTLSIPAWQAVSDLVITDSLPANWTYQPQSTTIILSDQNNDGVDEIWTYADTVNVEPSQSVVGTRTNLTWNVAQSPFGISQLDPNERVTIKFTALTPSDPADIVDGYNQNDSEICGLRDLDGNSTPETYFCSEDYAYVFVSPVMIDKDTTTPVVQAGNNATYTLTVINTDTNPVTGITLGDELPVGFTYVSGSATATLDGAPTTDPDTGAGGTAQAPEWSIGDIPGGSTYVLTFEALIDANTAAGEYDNDFWLDSTMPGISKFYDRGQTGQDPGTIMLGGVNQDPEQDEDVLVIARTLETEKGIIATSEVGTDAYEVAIGEIVRYRVQTQLPENSVTGFYVLDHVVAGMQLLEDSVRVSIIDNDGGLTVTDTYGADDSAALNGAKETGTAPYRAVTYLLPDDNLSTTLAGDTDDYTSTAATTGTDVYFKIGDIANTPNEANGEYVVIEYAAVVLNTTANQQGKVLANYFTANIDDDFNVDGSPDSVISNSVEVSVIEPVMNIAKVGALQYSAGIAQMVYTITVSNPGSVSAYNLQVTDQLDTSVGAAGKLDIEAGDIVLSTSTGTVSGVDMGASDYVTENVNITIDELAGNSSAVFMVTADVTGAVDGDTIDINTANLTYTSLPGATGTPAASNPTEAENPGPAGSTTGERTGTDGVGGTLNNYAAVATAPAITYTPPSLSVDKTSNSGGDNDGIVNPGDTITYTINIENTGGTPLTNIVVTDLVPAGTTFDSGTVSGYTLTGTAGPFDYRDDFASAAYNLSTGSQTWNAGTWDENGDNDLAGSGSISISGGALQFNTPTGDSIERTIGDLSNKVSVFLEIDYSEIAGQIGSNNIDADDTFFVQIWDGSAWQPVHSVSNDFNNPPAVTEDISAFANANTRIRLGTTNFDGGNEDFFVDYVRIYYTDFVPVAFNGALPHGQPNIIQSSDLFYLSATDGIAGSGPDFMTITYTVTVNDLLAAGITSIDNTVRVTSDEYTPVEVTDSVSDIVPQGIDVSLDKQVNNVAPSIGDVVTFTLTVANAGPRIATNINVTDVIPSGYTYFGSSIAGGDSRNDSSPVGTGLTWTINSLAAGASVDLTYQATVLAAGTYDNYAQITSHTQTDLDSTPGNNSTTEDDDDTITVSPLVYSIGDFVWLDLNSDGVQDGGAEAGIPGVTVFLDLNNNDAIDGGEPTDVTDGNGLYQFTGLSAGTYTVRIDTTTLPAGYTQTYDLDATLDHETVVILPDALSTGGTITSLDALLGACIPGNCPPAGSYPPGVLGAPVPLAIDTTYRDDGFSAFIGGNFTVTNEASETEGRLAVGGNFVLQNPSLDYGVGAAGGGSNIYAPDGSNWMVVRGNVSSVNPGVDTLIGLFTADGNAVIGGTASGIIINSFPPVGSINSGVGTSPAALGVDFDAIIADAQYKSALWSGLPATGTAVNAFSTLTFTGTNNPDFEVFTVPAGTSMSGVTTVEFVNVDPDATVLINVAGATRTVQMSSTILPDSPLNQSRNHILYNFYEATSLTIAGGGDVDGSILVPNVTGTTTLIGNVNGRVVIGGNAIHQGGGGNEIHNWPFEGSLPSADFEDADFGYVPTGTIVIVKDAIPDHAQDFAYTVTGTGPVPFSLDDDADATLSNTRTFASLTAGNYTVTETALAGWSLTGLTCTDPDSGSTTNLGTATATIDLDPGETVTCTFENNAALSIVTTKTADDTSIPETGQSVTYTVEIENTSPIDVTLDSLTDNLFNDITTTGHDNVTATTCVTGGTITAGATYSCTFTATVSGDFPGTHVNTVTAQVSNGSNTTTDTDDETVTFEDVQPDITIVKTADDNSVPETGQSVTFTFTVTNNSSESATITALSDSDFAVTGDADCQVGTVLAAGASCDFTHTATISGDFGGADHLNTASVTVTDDDGNTDNDTDDETVTFEDVLPVITVDKTAIPVSVPETGAPVTYTVVVTNTGTESVTLDSLTDDQFNDITTTGHDGITSSTCSTGGTIAPNGGVYSCTFIATVSGVPGIDHVNVVTADASDDDGNNDTKTDDATVSFTVVLGTVDGTVYLDVDGDGIYTSGIDTPLPNVDVTITDVNNTTYTVTTDVNGYFSQVVPAGDTDVDVNDADLPAGAALTTGSTDPTTVTVPAGGTATDDTGYIQQGTVDGTVYLDVDGDGNYTSGTDTPLPNVDVTITDVNNTTYTVTTDVNGYFSQVVPAGDTDVDVNDADLPAGAALTTGSTDPTTVNVPAGGTATDDTGYIQQGTVDGTVYLDVDDDGIYTSGIDTPLSGVDVTITDVNNTTYTVTTDVNGYFSQVVPAGDTDVDVNDADLPAGAALTTGSTDPTTVTVPAGGTATDDTGYIQQGTVDGTVYLDVDGDGIYTSGTDTPLPNVDVTITDVNGGTYTVTTDVNGYFSQVVPAGDTDVDVNDADLPAGAALTTGSTDPTTVNVPAGGTATDDTGYIQQGTVDGTVYLDLNNNGTYDAGIDTPLPNVDVTITDVNGGTYTVTTDVNGYFSQVVPAGDTDVDVNDADLPAGAALTTGSTDPTTVTVPAGGTATDDTGYIQQGTVDGTVYLDVDGDGIYTSGTDTPLSGVDVTITDVNNTTYTVTTDVNGYFSQVVPAGDTDVDVNDADLPAGAALTTGSTDPTTVNVPAGGTATDDTGYIQQGTVDGTVYLDLNNNGTYDAGIDTPLPNVDVTITDVNNTTYTVTTDVNGYFSQVVPAGDTDVDVNDADLPAGAALTTGSTDPTTVNVPAGGTATDDTGYIQQGTVDGTVYLDVDDDGIYTSGIDTPLSGVDVTITDVNNTTYTVTTDVNGYFSQVVPAGDTDVDVNDADLPAGAALTTGSSDPTTVTVPAGGTATDDTGYIQQGTVDGTVYLDVDGDGNYTSGIDTPLSGVDVTITDVNNTTYTVTTDVNGYFSQVVPAGDTDVDVNDADLPAGAALTTGSTDPTTVTVPAGGTATDDTGYIQQGTVDGTVYLDVDGDGIYTSGTDTPLPNVDVTITDVNNTTYTVTTDVNGYFSQVVPAGDTDVDVNDADLPAGAALTTGSTDPTTVNVPAGGTATDDTGYIQQGTVDGTVYLDVDDDGIYTSGIDTPLSGVDVTITDVNNTTYTVTTDVNGYFSQVVPAGDTDVDVNDADLPAGAALTTGSTDPTTVTVPAGGTATDDTGYIQQGTVDGTVYLDVDGDGIYTSGTDTPLPNVDVTITDVNGGTYTVTTDVNGYFSQVVPAGDTDVDVNDADLPAGAALTTGSTDPTTVNVPAGGTATDDTGYIQQGTVDGTVYLDLNNNGTYDAGIDTPLPNVDVTITDVNGGTYTVTTDVNGYFSQVVPAGDTDVDVNDADLPAGAALTTGSTDPTTVTVPAGGTATDDTGYIQQGTVDGTVYLDVDGDGIYTSGTDTPLSGVDVTITDVNNTTYTVTTDVNGYFSQVVPAGDTDVDVNDADLPAGAALTTGSTDPTTVTVPAGGTATDDTGYVQEGTISGTVYDDLNGDGNFDAGEPGIDGVSVTLLQDTDGNGSYETTVATVNTVNGDYSFTNLLAGAYRVVESDPSGYISTGDVEGVNDNLIDVTLVAGTNSINNDFFDWSFADLSLTKNVGNTTPAVATNITFTLTITNALTSTVPATGVVVTDVIPSGFTYVSDIPSQGTYNDATGEWSVGTLAIGASATLELTVSVNITGSYTNSAEITAELEIDPDSTPGNSSTTEDDDDSVTVTPTQDNPTQGKNVSDSSHTFTTGNNVAIGEVVTYSVTITVPPGVFDNAQLVDTMERGLSFMACDSIAVSDPLLTTDVAGSFTGACSNPTVEAVDDSGNPSAVTVDVGRRVTFDLGRLENTSGADQTLTFTYTAVVLDSAANIAGTDLTNSAVWTSTQSGALPPATATVSILEPDLSIEKTANTSLVSVGSEITITLTIQHTGASQTDAFDALVTDVLPVELELVTGTLECVSGAQNADTCVYDAGTRTVRAVWNAFTRTGGNGQVTFRVRVVSLPPSGVSNTANVAWTSLPGDVSTPQNSNPFSTERDYDPASQIDVYGASDTLVLGVFTNALPATGFAPSVITDPGIQREAYAPTGGLTVEIPSLGIHIPIVGVPLKNGEWDVSWLGNQAGWLEGSAFPSWSGNSVLTSHVYDSNGLPGPFVSLNSLKYGDKIIVHAYGRKYTYEVRSNTVVEPNDVSVFRHEDKAWLTLVTCKEYDEKTNTYKKRVVLRTVLVSVGWE